jgi:hypothetical protein
MSCFFVFFIGKEGLPVWWLFRSFTSNNQFFTATSVFSFHRLYGVPVPYSIATLEGFLNKADKSKGYHFLTKDVEDVPPLPNDKKLVIEDGNAA